MKTLAAAVAVFVLGSAGVAIAQQSGMMGCCKDCCEKMKDKASAPSQPIAPAHAH